jgi:hypothetical protein
MKFKLLQLEQRIQELESLADEVDQLAVKQGSGKDVQPELSTKGQRWYRGTREIFVQQNSSGLNEFESCYTQILQDVISGSVFVIGDPNMHVEFGKTLALARSLLAGVIEEIKSRELPIKTQLSFAVSADEFEKALELVDSSGGDEVFLRAGGVVGRVALERHLWAVVDAHGVPLIVNPPTKKKAEAQDLLTSLVKANVITSIQRSELESLFAIGNNCAHPKDTVVQADVERLIKRGRELASVIL